MNKLAKVGIVGAVVAASLAALVLGVFFITFDINNYQGVIARMVAEKTGRELSFGGDISLTLFPRLGVCMENVSLSDAPGFGDGPMATVGTARLDVCPLSLVSGKVRFGHLDIQRASVALRRDPSGRTNWDDLTSRAAMPGSAAERRAGGGEAADGLLVLEIEGVSVTDSSLAWIDRAGGASVSLSDVSLTTGTIVRGAPFGVSFQGAVCVEDTELAGTLEVSAAAAFPADLPRVDFTDATLRAVLTGAAVPGSRAGILVRAESASVELRGSGQAGHTLRVDGLTVSGYGVTARASGSVTGVGSAARLTASVGVDPFAVRQTLAALGMDAPRMADPAALSRAGATAALVVDAGGFDVRELEAVIDDTAVSGSFSRREREGSARYVLRLAITSLDLDRYLPLSKAERPGPPPAEEGLRDAVPLMDVAWLRGLSLDLEATVQSLRFGGVRMTDVQAAAGARHGLVRISPVKAALYGGQAALGLTVNAVSDHPASDLIVGVERVDVCGLSRDAWGGGEYQGVLTLNAALGCQGTRREAMLRSMNGRFTLGLSDGVFPGVDLMGLARTAQERRAQGQGSVEAADTDSTRFGSITATGVVSNGVLRSRDLEVKAPGLRADGQGSVDLPSGRIDSLIKVKLVPTAQGQGGRSSDNLYGVMVPIRVTGTVEHPRYRVSIQEYIRVLGGAVLDTAESVVEGVSGVLKDVGKAIVGGEETREGGADGKRSFFGLF
ncbi:AsmA family protein [Pseudodesulfovibrio sp. F-1]|uniref:AsmA family protein n=1 Tax=Pseudodesulfovibrio alkaliphilus TaxID=2661613 RepID=A0A7K1KPK6_9BACT|nr:AsmA family protein [Pseudodesulfovibrio alkaliphilus]MUM78026.1 AsmA family protein [Pseudodesulfovibrio alkaliphilus]